MTTIAYRNGIVAADRLITNDHFIFKPQATKLTRQIHPTGTIRIIGRAGDVAATQEWFDWVANGKQGDTPDNNEDGGYVIEFTSGWGVVSVTVYNVETGTNWTLPLAKDDYIAYGSGEDYAHGAMAYGASAYEAVLAASKHDTATGNEIDTLSFKQED